MIEHGFTPEHVQYIADAAFGLYVLGMSFTTGQRRWIRDRDGNRCNFPAEHNCNGEQELHVHHLMGQRYCRQLGINPDYPENALTICSNSHTNLIHEDMVDVRRVYRRDKGAFQRMFDSRAEMLKQRKIYWNSQWDRPMVAIAVRNTQRRIAEGDSFPSKNRRRRVV